MRLLNVKTLQLEMFYGSDVPDYAALSHTWGDGEVTIHDLTTDLGREKKGWSKIIGSTIKAINHNCDYIWIDTCCIDKDSSAELSEAINSMFRWYRKSKVCFAYLEDICEEPRRMIREVQPNSREMTASPSPEPARSLLSNSRWFTRGWTLQELIAPKTVYFYDSSWNEIGEKRQLEKEISEITGINSNVLHDYNSMYTESIAHRMSWASHRQTTKIEDIAYCLLGIFNVNMPLLYGEGEKAFSRLQEEIMRSSYDQSLFAWNHQFPNSHFGSTKVREDKPLIGVGLLAPHPVAFEKSAHFIPHTIRTEPYEITNRGLRICLRLLEYDRCTPPSTQPLFENGRPSFPPTHFAILQCGHKNKISSALAMPIAKVPALKVSALGGDFCRPANQDMIEVQYSQAAPLPRQDVYFLTAGPLFLSQESGGFHRCWLRSHGQDVGIKLHKARFCEYPVLWTDVGNPSYSWDYKSNSMTWATIWRGSRAALHFSKKNGPTFVVILTFKSLSDEGEEIGMDVHIEPVLDSSKESPKKTLREFLAEELTHGQIFHLTEAQKMLALGDQLMTVRVKKDAIFDEDIFIVDFFLSGIKRGTSESTVENSQKRSKQSKSTSSETALGEEIAGL